MGRRPVQPRTQQATIVLIVLFQILYLKYETPGVGQAVKRMSDL